MASGFQDLECVICNENLLDPRPLPCGHSYCGPPRLCLTGLKSSTGGICCAICRMDHDLKPGDIKPLYGIRECFSSKSTTPDIPCSAHTSKECTFWCNDCETMICVDCTEDEHDGHFMRNLKKHLISKVEAHFGNSWRDKIVDYRENLEKMKSSQKFELEKLKLRMEEIEKLLQAVQIETSVIDSYIETLRHGNDEKRANETLSLLNLSNLELLEVRDSGMDKAVEKNESSTQCNAACCENSTQYECFTRSVSSQSDSLLACVKKSTASQTNTCSLSSASNSYDRVSNDPHPSSFDDYFDNYYVVKKSSDDEMSDCCCTLEHEKVSIWNFPICQRATLQISQRNPLVIRKSNTLFLCPFKFWVEAELVQHKHKRNEKMFKIIVFCTKAIDDSDDLPASTFRYAFVLNNHNKNGVNKKYEGTWHYPKHKELYWHSITYSQLIKPGSGWIDNNNDVKVEIELLKVM